MTSPIGFLAPEGTAPEPTIPAGGFSAWLDHMDRALGADRPMDVPCGDCRACCEGSYFIHVHPYEATALERIPAALLFPAPGGPEGERLLGYDEAGRCPMLMDSRCSIYDARPATCRTYDCRLFAATGLADTSVEKEAIMARARSWAFEYEDETARQRHRALLAGAALLAGRPPRFQGRLPTDATRLAMLSVRLHRALAQLYEARGGVLQPEPEVLEPLSEAFEALRGSTVG